MNGTVSKVILGSGISSLRLLEVRSLGAALGFVLVLLVVAPSRLGRRGATALLAVFGICGLAFVQWFYFLSIHRLSVGIALLDRVPGRTARRAVGALRLPRARSPRSGRIQSFPEIDRVEWFDLDEARRRLKAAQVPFLDRLQPAAAD